MNRAKSTVLKMRKPMITGAKMFWMYQSWPNSVSHPRNSFIGPTRSS